MTQSCSWCHEPNDLNVSTTCGTCGHRADLPRMACDCNHCQPSVAERMESADWQAFKRGSDAVNP